MSTVISARVDPTMVAIKMHWELTAIPDGNARFAATRERLEDLRNTVHDHPRKNPAAVHSVIHTLIDALPADDRIYEAKGFIDEWRKAYDEKRLDPTLSFVGQKEALASIPMDDRLPMAREIYGFIERVHATDPEDHSGTEAVMESLLSLLTESDATDLAQEMIAFWRAQDIGADNSAYHQVQLVEMLAKKSPDVSKLAEYVADFVLADENGIAHSACEPLLLRLSDLVGEDSDFEQKVSNWASKNDDQAGFLVEALDLKP